MVAVPTVLGIASIRVYTVSEASTGGLVTREKLNIYTPLLQSAQDQFIPERPGVIERRLTTVRESILPFFQAVQGAFVSVKRGSVNLYHAGEDVYYYLKDPPPGFLPRFGTINMAGLLGMFLARKGSRFKRIALPLGLMSAGASVCYPAQTVAVLKVTGKKVYAAGQWSSTAVSSLLISKSREPATKEIAAAHPQAATVPNTESAVFEEASEPSSVQSATVPETEVELALSVPVSDEHIVTVITEEASSVTLTELSPDQTSTETIADPVAHSVPAETETTTTSGEIPAPVESEEPSDTKNAAEDVSPDSSPAKQTLSSEPEIVEAAPVEVVLVESAVPLEAEAAPVEAVPSSEEPPAPKASVPVVESGEPEPAVQPELADPPQVAAVEETLTPTPPQQSAAEISKVPAETETTTTSGEIPTPVESEEPSETKNAGEDVSPDSSPAKQTLSSEPEMVEAAPVEVVLAESAVPVEAEAAPVEAVPSSEEPPAPKASDEAAVPVVESGEPEPAVQPELADPPQVAAVEETLTPTPPQQSAAEISKGGTGFKPDPAVMDFGQSNPEDEDLYSTRS